MLTWSDIETSAIAFQKRWKDTAGDERQDGQTFEKDFMSVFGVDWHEGFHEHQIITSDGVINYIDYYLPGKILIEMKSRGKSLDVAFSQAMQYVRALKPEEQPVLVMVSDFDTIRVYNTTKQHHYKPFRVTTLKPHVRIFGLLAGYGLDADIRTEIEVNTDASYKMAKLHDALKENGYAGHELEVYLVRLLFCLFADDTGIFEKSTFFNYLQNSNPDGSDLSGRLSLLFSILDTPDEHRMKNLPEELKRFRYINGNLFSERLSPPFFSAKMRTILLECCDFDWTQISPAIFGAMFQGVMNPQERRELGAHYTSEENILKVIRPLFLDDLYEEFERSKNTTAELQAFHNKIASLTFLDPACGCGNFLIITYQRLRQLEFEILKLLQGTPQMTLLNVTKVHIGQFYGIEIEEFPCEIAKVSMLLMKHLMDQEISHYFGGNYVEFPIKDNANIVNANALRTDWNDVVPANKLDCIMGNPPFVGKKEQNKDQKLDLTELFDNKERVGNLDYVIGWYKKTVDLMSSYKLKAAFVSTNSITQGEQAPLLQKFIFGTNLEGIDFAYRTFKWGNEAKAKAAVHCVIIGFSNIKNNNRRIIYLSDGTSIPANNINAYLYDAPSIVITRRSIPISDVKLMNYGSMPIDGGTLILSEEDRTLIIAEDPRNERFIRQYIGGDELLNNKKRWCLWLVGVSPMEFSHSKLIMNRIQRCRAFRQQSDRKQTLELADYPYLFGEIRQPDIDMLVLPKVSSENRDYLPIDIVHPSVIINGSALIIPGASLYDFGILSSGIHASWLRAVGGRMKSDYQYSKDIVYNTFPWPQPAELQSDKIKTIAQQIFFIRNHYFGSSLAELYNSLTMPQDLRKAHNALDKEVMRAYGKNWQTEEECVAYLMKLYQDKTQTVNSSSFSPSV